MKRGPKPKSQRQKLLDGHVVNASTGCWEWAGPIGYGGYGRVSSGVANKYNSAHRSAYEEFVGPIPGGKCVCHKCDNRRCINPEHLWLGTHADNARDMVQKGRSLVGAKHHNATLTEAMVRQIRDDSRRFRDIAADYGITYGMVGHIKRRFCWRHVP